LKKVIILKITLYKLKIKLIVYTFGSPRGLTEDHVQPFQNVFNFVFGADVVTYVAPYFPVSGYTFEKESIEWFFGLLKAKGTDSTGGYSFQTRELFAKTIQPHIALVLFIFLSDTSIIDELTKEGAIKILEWLMVEDFFYAEFYAGKFLLHFDIFCKKSIELWRISFKIRL